MIRINAVPGIFAGVLSIHCECGWEKVYIIPEEHALELADILTHLQEQHKIKLPVFSCMHH